MGEGETGAGRTGGTADSQGRRGHTHSHHHSLLLQWFCKASFPFPRPAFDSSVLESGRVALVLSSVLESGCGTAFSPPLKKPVVKTEGTWRK